MIEETTGRAPAAPIAPDSGATRAPARILVVDDEREIADLVATYLQNAGYEVRTFYDGQDAWECVQREPLDLAIIDVMLPGMSGFELCELVRRDHMLPIIMLTAKIDEADRVRGLTAGADDYVTKPFLPLELVARVKAQLRRSTQYNQVHDEAAVSQDMCEIGGLSLNMRTRECTMNEHPVLLTPTEFEILRILCENRGKAVTAKEMYRRVWGDGCYSKSSGSIAVHVRHLREKLGDSFEKPKYIKTVWGCGYKID